MKNLKNITTIDQQEQLLSLLIEGPDFVSLTSMEGIVNYVNQAGRDMLSSGSLEESIAPLKDYIVPADWCLLEEINEIIRQSGKWSGQIHYRHFKTGESIPVLTTMMLIYDAQREVPASIATISRDMRTDMKARSVQQKLSALVNQSKDMMSLLNPDGTNDYINPAGRHLLGISEEEDVTKIPISRFHTPEQLAFVEREILPAVYEKGEWFGRFAVRNQLTGEIIPMENKCVRIDDPHTGEAVAIGAVMRDIRGDLAAMNSISESEIKFRNLIMEAPLPTSVYTGPDLIIEMANQPMIELWGKDHSVIGKALAEALPELEGQHFIPTLKKVFDTGIAYHADQEKANLVVNGKLQSFWFNYTYKPLRNAEGKVYAILNMAVDVTKQVYLQQQKDEFIGMASHELKTPVTSIKGYTQVLESILADKGLVSETNMLSRINQQVNKLTQLIGDLLDVTKVQSGKLLFNNKIFSLNQLIEETVQDMRFTSPAHILITSLTVDTEIFGDPERVSQVLQNLLSNAIKYSSAGAEVIIRSSLSAQNVIVEVEDFGIGIPEDKLESVFERFYRVAHDKQHTFPGLGLGLYIAAEIVRRMGGTMWVRSVVGKGSVFYFSLPVRLSS